MTIDQRAEVLIQALPYIKAYNQKIVVIKYGGNAMINEDLKRAVMGDLLLLTLVGVKVVLVHGGGPEITDLLKRLGKKSEFIDGLRVTDREAADIVQMVLAGKVGKGLVGYIQSMGGKAIGLCGMDGHMIEARKLDDVHGYVGEIVNVNTQPILDVLEKGYIPVISTVGCDSEGNPYNINADTAAARIAASLGAESLISMTDIRGILRDPADGKHPHSRHSGQRGPAAHPRGHHLRRHDPQDRMLHRGHPPGREKGVHHRRPRAARHFD